MTTLYLDLETFSELDLKTVGTHAYAEHPSTEIIVAQWGVDDGAPVVVDCTDPFAFETSFPVLEDLLHDDSVTITAHNSHFDRTIMRHVWGINVPVERWRDTMVKAMAHGLPGGLDKVGQIMGVEDDKAKDKRGKELIQLFCKPRPANSKLRRATRETHPSEWAEFLEYSRQDIVAMREIDRKLPTWNYRDGHPELALWHLDQRINDRGMLMDLDLANAAIEAVAVEQKRLKREVTEATDGAVTNASQRDNLLEFILNEYGVELPDMRADTLRRRAEDPELPEAVRLLLSIRLEATKTSTAKYRAVVNAVSADGRLRNTLQFCGAQRTGRWAGRIFQPQNMPRPSRGFDDEAQAVGVEALKLGCAPITHGNVMQLTADCVRGVIIAPPGRKLVVSDLSNIEGRGLAWLAGEQWKLDAFGRYDAGTGPDLYNVAYGRSFNVDPEGISSEQRQIGKVQELACGYQGGPAAYLTMAAVYKMDLARMSTAVEESAPSDVLYDAEGRYKWMLKNGRVKGMSAGVFIACQALVSMWRAAHPAVVQLWADAEYAVRAAILNPGEIFPLGKWMRARRDGQWLRVQLPSGRYLCYLNPRVDDTGQISYAGVNQYTRQWSRIKTYGGKLCIAAGTPVLARRGWVTIESITPNDQVWDGVAWVSCAGAVCNGVKAVVSAHGVLATPDHLILTEQGWKSAETSERYKRAACRLPYGAAPHGQRHEGEGAVVCPVRVRGSESAPECGPGEGVKTQSDVVVRVPTGGNGKHKAAHARDVETPGLRGVAEHDRPLFAADASGLGQLRRAWHHCVRALARGVQELLAGHGVYVPTGSHAGPQGQQQGLQQDELPLGDVHRASAQHPLESLGERQTGRATGGRVGDRSVDVVLPAVQGGADEPVGRGPELFAEVYDIVNCGPRRRFVVWADGAPLIVHNCENFTQAVAKDIMAANMSLIEACGYEIILTVHDELLTETPDDPNEFNVDGLSKMMAHRPRWAPGIPLAAAGFEAYRYRKD